MTCRSCKGSNLFTAFDLGHSPISNELLLTDSRDAELYELKMIVCKDCGLGQVSKDLPRERLFSNTYTFASSVSANFVEHAKKYSDMIIEKINIDKEDWVLELASNDGYMLKHFKEKNIKVLGIDPASNIAQYAILNDIPTLCEFFGEELGKKVLSKKGYPKLIIANNVLAHVPDILDFIKGISVLVSDETIVTIENPSIINILKDNQFDTIYHEHYSYLSAFAVDKLAKSVGLTLFNVEKIPTMGGSNRYWIGKNKIQQDSVLNTIKEETEAGLLDEDEWKKTYTLINKLVKEFHDKIVTLYNDGKKIYGYTASSKATVLLNFAKVPKGYIIAVADDGIDKQNKYIPGPNIPIITFDNMIRKNPDEVIVFAWNVFNILQKKVFEKNNNINVWSWINDTKYSI